MPERDTCPLTRGTLELHETTGNVLLSYLKFNILHNLAVDYRFHT